MSNETQRADLAEELLRIPTSCPADLHDWMQTGEGLFLGGAPDYEDVVSPIPNTSSGAMCALYAAKHPHRTCWCGRFQAGRELTR